MTIRRKVQRVIDGDSFTVRKRVNHSQHIRLANVNAPERGQNGYFEAKNKLKRIEGKVVAVTPRGKSYGRTVADVRYKRRRVR